jgi:hypothetical protein
MWEPRCFTTLWVSGVCYRDCFTFFSWKEPPASKHASHCENMFLNMCSSCWMGIVEVSCLIFSLSFSKECELFTYTFSFSVPQGFILSDHGGHGPLLVTKMLKTLCSASIGLFTMCALALSCIKYLYVFPSWANWLKKGDNNSHKMFGIYYLWENMAIYSPYANFALNLSF